MYKVYLPPQLYCVWWDVKLYLLAHRFNCAIFLSACGKFVIMAVGPAAVLAANPACDGARRVAISRQHTKGVGTNAGLEAHRHFDRSHRSWGAYHVLLPAFCLIQSYVPTATDAHTGWPETKKQKICARRVAQKAECDILNRQLGHSFVLELRRIPLLSAFKLHLATEQFQLLYVQI